MDVTLRSMARVQPLRGRQVPDSAFLVTLRAMGGWVSANDLAACHGLSWHSVSYALQRMINRGEIEIEVVEVAGKARSVEHSRVYRSRPQQGEIRLVGGGLPAWLAPQAVVAIGSAVLVRGRVGVHPWDDHEPPAKEEVAPPAGVRSLSG